MGFLLKFGAIPSRAELGDVALYVVVLDVEAYLALYCIGG